MLVKMKVQTRWGDRGRYVGEMVEVDERTGRRWIGRGIAEEVQSKGQSPKPKAEEPPPSPGASTGSATGTSPSTGSGAGDDGLEKMKFRELKEAAKAKGVEFQAVGTSRKKLIGLIRESDARRGGEE